MLKLLSFLLSATIVAAVVGAAPVDRAYNLIGTWTCQTASGSKASMTFTKESDDSISMRNVFVNDAGASGEFDELYRFVMPEQYWRWIATLQDRPDFKQAATGGMWTAQKWFFDGTVTQRPHRHDTETHRIRMIYTWISDSSFEREFEVYEDGVWKSSSSSLCRRESS